MNFIPFIITLLLTLLSPLTAIESESLLDLEDVYLQEFIICTKQIKVSGFPYAFNPSLIPWKGGLYLMSFRAGKMYTFEKESAHLPGDSMECGKGYSAPSYSPNRMGLVFLDSEFRQVGMPQILEVPNENPTYRQQDARLVWVGGRIYIVYSDVVEGIWAVQTRRMKVAELCYEDGHFFVGEVECLSEFDGMRDARWEKNWVPFDYEDHLLLAYSLNPHKIFYPLFSGGVCALMAESQMCTSWKWGELRGGTPAILVDGEYLAFFHSSIATATKQSKGIRGQHYFMGAYTFSSEPPFEITKVSPTPIVGKQFYEGAQYQTWKPNLQVVFPSGIVAEGEFIYVAYGRQDHEIWIAKLDKKGLFQSLESVLSVDYTVCRK